MNCSGRTNKSLDPEPALGGFVVSGAFETLIPTRLSVVSVNMSYVSKINAKWTGGIAKMVSPPIQKYRNLRNFTRAERLRLY